MQKGVKQKQNTGACRKHERMPVQAGPLDNLLSYCHSIAAPEKIFSHFI